MDDQIFQKQTQIRIVRSNGCHTFESVNLKDLDPSRLSGHNTSQFTSNLHPVQPVLFFLCFIIHPPTKKRTSHIKMRQLRVSWSIEVSSSVFIYTSRISFISISAGWSPSIARLTGQSRLRIVLGVL